MDFPSYLFIFNLIILHLRGLVCKFFVENHPCFHLSIFIQPLWLPEDCTMGNHKKAERYKELDRKRRRRKKRLKLRAKEVSFPKK